MAKKPNTSWGSVAEWYSTYLEDTADSYQRQVIVPNLLRIIGPNKGMRLLDLACGQGFFAREFAKSGAAVVGADISKELIAEAKKLSPKGLPFYATPSHQLDFADDHTFDAVVVVLAIQNIERMAETFAEAARVLAKGGRLVLVLMHPAFRVPKGSGWGWDEEEQCQYRRIDNYLSASRSELVVHPGKSKSPTTVSYHRSMQDISKALFKAGFAITRLEEWVSHKESQKGPRQKAENRARKEIPLFLMLEAAVR